MINPPTVRVHFRKIIVLIYYLCIHHYQYRIYIILGNFIGGEAKDCPHIY